MKTRKLILSGLFVFGALTIQAQNVVSNQHKTSGGLDAGNHGTGNAFYGVAAGRLSEPTFVPSIEIPTDKDFNTYIGNWAGYLSKGSNNVYIGYGTGLRANYSPRPSLGDLALGTGNVFIGSNVRYTLTDSNSSINNRLAIDNSATTTPLIWGDFAEDQLKFNGKVGIGFGFGDFPTEAGIVDVEDYNLFVYGGILTEEVRVMLEGDWADYVFEEDYNLPKLEEVEQFIKENKHLPNVPSAKEVAQNGIELGEIAKIQQEKIEELTLYLIQQQKELNELKEQVKLLLESQK